MTKQDAIRILKNHSVDCWIDEHDNVIAVDVLCYEGGRVEYVPTMIELTVKALRDFLNY